MSRKGRKLTQVHYGGSGEAAESQSCWGIRLWGAGREGQWRCGTPIGHWSRLLLGRQLPGTPAEKVSHDCILTPGQKPCHPTQPHTSGNPTSRRKSSGSPWGSSRLPGNCSLPIPDNLLTLLFPLSPAEEEAAQTAVELGLSRAEMH